MTGSTMKNDDDRRVCRTVLDFISKRKNIIVHDIDYPEEQIRDRQAVEMVAKTSSGEIFFEHTRIQAFGHEIDGWNRFYKLLKEPLEKGLDGKLPPPGHYTLSADIAATRGTKWKAKHIQKVLIEWVKNKAPSLELGSTFTAPNHMVTEKPAGVPFEVTLSRWPAFDGRFWATSISLHKSRWYVKALLAVGSAGLVL